MITINNINEVKQFAKGENYTICVEDYDEAMNQAQKARAMINEQFTKVNPYIKTTIFPLRKRNDRYCVEVWMQYSDMTSINDIRVRFFFVKNYFRAARNFVTERNKERESNELFYNMFGF